MTDAAELVRKLRTAGTDLWVEAGWPRVRAPAEVLTPERRVELTTHRDAVLALVVAEADVWALDRLGTTLVDDGADPPGASRNRGGCGRREHNEKSLLAPETVSALLDIDAALGTAAAPASRDCAAWRQMNSRTQPHDGRPCLMNTTCCMCGAPLPPRRHYLCPSCADQALWMKSRTKSQGGQP